MGHNHSHHHHSGSKNILVAFFLNAGFAVIEFIGGYLTNSVAIYSDALHDLGDSIALLFSWYSEKISHKDPDEKFTYGYRRFSVLSAFINGFILLGGSFFVLYEAVKRLSSPEPVVPEGMLVLAILGVLVNSIAAWRLSKDDGINQRMVMFHLMEDILGWVAVLIVSIILLFKPWYILDSILSILISLIILRGVYKNMLTVGAIFLQKFPESLEMDQIKEAICSLELVQSVHAVKGWSIDEEHSYLGFHVTVPKVTQMGQIDDIKTKVKAILHDHKVFYSTIEFESSDDYECIEHK